MVLYIASSNPGKLRDFRLVADAFPGFALEPLPGLSAIPAPPEDEPTLEGNARAKAVYYSRHAPGMWVLADDSGLEVDALGGRPGVRSARFADHVGLAGDAADRRNNDIDSRSNDTDRRNNEALMLAMLEQTDRRARYRCVLAVAMDGAVETVTSGKVEGTVLTEPEGTGGFGYDPLFHATELGCSMANAEPADRMRVSHRGRALAALLRRWKAC